MITSVVNVVGPRERSTGMKKKKCHDQGTVHVVLK